MAKKNHTVLDALGTSDLAFVLDPLDGTKNFASGLPLFGLMAVAIVRGQVLLAAIHDPYAAIPPSPSGP